MSAERLREFLEQNQVKYVLTRHSTAFTAQEVAAAAHIPGRSMAKTVMVRIGDQLAMAVLPASEHVDVQRLQQLTGQPARLASEAEFRSRFPDCELGAMPPFGNLYDMDVYVSEDLGRNEMIGFNAGSHRELIQMRYDDFARLVQPRKVALAYAR